VKANIIIVFNKIDLFREKIKTKDLRDTFPEYGGGNDYGNALEFITKKYVDKLRGRDCDVVYTCATGKCYVYSSNPCRQRVTRKRMG
jgi:GTPase SAR1 family protein